MERNVNEFLEESFIKALEDWDVDTLTTLVRNGNISNNLINIKNERGCTPLFIACEKSNSNLVSLLIDKGANVNEPCVYGNTPLHVASAKDNSQIVKYLIEKGAYLDLTNERNESALHKACQMNLPKNVKVLLDNGANPDIPNGVERTVLFSVCFSGYTKIAKLLVEANANVNACDLYKETPLQVACKYDYLDIAKLLLENGASPDIEVNNKNIVQWAIEREEYDFVDLLIKKDATLPMDWIVRQNKKHSLQLIIKNGRKIPLVYNNVDLLAESIHNNNVVMAALLMKNKASNVTEKVENLHDLMSLKKSDRILKDADNDAKKDIKQLKRERENEAIIDILCTKKNKYMEMDI